MAKSRTNKLGRPKSLIKRVKKNFCILEELGLWLDEHKQQQFHIEAALKEYIRRFKN